MRNEPLWTADLDAYESDSDPEEENELTFHTYKLSLSCILEEKLFLSDYYSAREPALFAPVDALQDIAVVQLHQITAAEGRDDLASGPRASGHGGRRIRWRKADPPWRRR